MSDVRFIDTTVRDGNQSLWALNMRTDAMLAVAEHIDEAGFESVEFFVTVMFKKLVRSRRRTPGTGSGWAPSASRKRRCGSMAGSRSSRRSRCAYSS